MEFVCKFKCQHHHDVLVQEEEVLQSSKFDIFTKNLKKLKSQSTIFMTTDQTPTSEE